MKIGSWRSLWRWGEGVPDREGSPGSGNVSVNTTGFCTHSFLLVPVLLGPV